MAAPQSPGREPVPPADAASDSRGRGRRDKAAYGVSAACHGTFLIVAAIVYMNAGLGNHQTLISSTWADSPPVQADEPDVVELMPVEQGGKGGNPDPGQVIRAVGTFAATKQAGLSLDAGSGFGGAFFGAGGGNSARPAKRIVYIVDASGSMNEHLIRVTRFARVQRELEASILSLSKKQQFAIILFNENSRAVGAKSLRYATDPVKSRTIDKIWDSAAGGGTDPRGAINRALRLHPDTIYFLTDGVFPPMFAQELLKGRYRLTVHTFTLGDSSGEAVMRRIAEANGGTYRFVDGKPKVAEETASAPPQGPKASSLP